jgi:hypothetical protein
MEMMELSEPPQTLPSRALPGALLHSPVAFPAMPAGYGPSAWRRSELANDTRWILPLSKAAIAGLNRALAHAKACGKPMLGMSPEDFPLTGAALDELRLATDATQRGFGLCLLRGLPVRDWSVDDAMLVFWGMGLHTGVARTQGRSSDFMHHVRDEGGGNYRGKGGRGYNTNAALDFHCDFCDLVGLLCLNVARRGGQSFLTSSMAVHDEIARRDPELLQALYEPFHYSYQGAQAPGDAPWFTCPIFGTRDGRFASRCNRKNVVAAHADFPDIAPLTARQHAAIELFEQVVRDPELCFSMELQPGDVQLLNNHVVLHSRSEFEDWPEPERKRHLLRFWLALPQGQALPAGWKAGYQSVEAGTVRGGLRGSAITPGFVAYEQRLARFHGMALPPATA